MPQASVEVADVLLVVGNGLSLSLGASVSPSLAKWHTSRPLSWNVPVPSDSGPLVAADAPLLTVFPQAQAVIDQARSLLSVESSDFDILNKARELVGEKDDSIAEIAGLRHVIAHCYSAYQIQSDEIDKKHWKLGNQIKKLASSGRLAGVISFNYDLNVESILDDAGVGAYHVGVGTGVGMPGQIPICKPHGSIDYAPEPNVFVVPPKILQHPRIFFAERTNSQIQQLDKAAWTKNRIAVDLVLPTEKSEIEDFYWVKEQKSWLAHIAPQVRVVVVVGISYMRVDRGELDTIFAGLTPLTLPVVIDPCPNSDLVTKFKRLYGMAPLENSDIGHLPVSRRGPARRDRRGRRG